MSEKLKAAKIESSKYKNCNHHHEIADDQEVVDFGTGEFVADKPLLPLLKALNEVGIKTRSHCSHGKDVNWIGILLDESIDIEISTVFESASNRNTHNGTQLIIRWSR